MPSAITTLFSASLSIITARMMTPASWSPGRRLTKLWSILILSTGNRPIAGRQDQDRPELRQTPARRPGSGRHHPRGDDAERGAEQGGDRRGHRDRRPGVDAQDDGVQGGAGLSFRPK